jgi:hypothetical protein
MSIGSSTRELAANLPLSTVTPGGLAILDDGTLIRAVKLESALSPLRMSAKEMERTNKAVQEIPALLPDRQTLQLMTSARPFDWAGQVDALQATANEVGGALRAEGLNDRADALSRLAVAGAEGLVEQSSRLSAMDLEHLLIMPWKPNQGALRGNPRFTLEAYAEAVEELTARFDQNVTHLDTLGLHPKELNGEEFLSSLYRALNPAGRPGADLASLLHEPAFDTDPDTAFDHAYDLRNALCATEIDDRSRTHLRAGDHIIHSRALTSTPEHTFLGWLLHLAQSPYPFTLSVRWEAGSRTRERAKARARYKRIYGLQRGKEMRLKPVDVDARQREQEALNLTAEFSSSAGAGVYRVAVNLNLISPPDPVGVFHTDEDRDEDCEKRAKSLHRWARTLEQEVLTRTDARLHLPLFTQMEGWRESWPLAIDALGLKRRYVTQNLADTIPIVSARCGSPDGIHFGWEQPGRTECKLDPYDPTHRNHIMVVSAPSGGGKTMATNLILGRILPRGATGAIIDRAGHYEPLARLVPGSVAVNLGTNPGFGPDRKRLDPWQMNQADRPPAINPWDVEDPRELPTEKLKYLLALHAFFLGQQGSDGTYDLTPTESSHLSRAIRDVYIRCASTREAPRELILQEVLLSNAGAELENENPEGASSLRRLADSLYDYVGDGSRAYLCDWPTTVDHDSPLVIFDTREVAESDAGAAMCSIFEFQHNAAKRAKELHAHRGPWGGRTFLIVDEGWKMLERESTGRWFNERARRSRHDGLFFIGISQSLSDFTDKKQGAALVSQSSIQLFFQQEPEQADFIADYLKLSDSERETLANLRTVKGRYAQAYFRNGRRGSGLIEIRAGAAEYWYATSEKQYDQPLRAKVLAEHNDDMWAALADLAANYEPLTA